MLEPPERKTVIADLRSRIRLIEQRPVLQATILGAPVFGVQAMEAGVSATDGRNRQLWSFGDPAFDALWPPGVLATHAVHEVKPVSAQDWPAALAFALRLGARRLAALGPEAVTRPLLWCATTAFTAEHGRLHAPGLAALGLSLDIVLVVETAREAETLWVLEESLRSRVPAVAVGGLKAISPTAARRLSLAAAEASLPCLALTAPATDGAASAATRWRISRAPSAPHPFDPDAPGAPRLRLTLARCRGAAETAYRSELVEWCDVTHRFRMAAGVADRTAASILPGDALVPGGSLGRRAGCG